MRSKQQLLLSDDFEIKREHGGSLAKGKRKGRRPFTPKRPIHLVLRSNYAKGERSLLHPNHARFIDALVRKLAARWNVRVYEFANASNHLHMVVRAKERRGFRGFLRALTGHIAMRVTGAAKGRKLDAAFWDVPPVYALAQLGPKELVTVKSYVVMNRLEALGLIPYRARKKRRLKGESQTPSPKPPPRSDAP